jgi:hypothetical protein
MFLSDKHASLLPKSENYRQESYIAMTQGFQLLKKSGSYSALQVLMLQNFFPCN